jgi:hypothetical protein
LMILDRKMRKILIRQKKSYSWTLTRVGYCVLIVDCLASFDLPTKLKANAFCRQAKAY